jgi:hypothetical protein
MKADDALRRCDVIAMETASGCMIHKAKLNELGVLVWVDTSTPVSLTTVLDDTWQRYHPEPKCPACKRANELNKEYGSSAIADHLTEPAPVGHCTCKEDSK